MKAIIPITQLAEISKLVADKMGLYFPKDRWPDLDQRICYASHGLGYNDPQIYVQHLLASHLTRNQTQTLASYLTIGETYFFREKESLEAMKTHILPALVNSRQDTNRCIRIWSAGCCTGEEPYSIAILLTQCIPYLKKDWQIYILATDINPYFLQKASQGVYKEWSFRGTPQWVKERMFNKKKDGNYEIIPEIRNMVCFSYLNLAEYGYPSLDNGTNAIDIIFCRNVLMYFSPQHVARVVRSFYSSLIEGGWLIVSPSETSPILYSQFITVHWDGAILYKKDSNKDLKTDILHEFQVKETTKYEPLSSAVGFEPTPPPISLIAPCHKESLPIPVVIKEEKSEQSLPDPLEEARSLYGKGQYEQTAEKLLSLLDTEHKNSQASFLMARVYADQGKLTDALAWCDKGIASDKLNPYLYYLRAMILQEQGQTGNARVSLQKALYLDQDFVLAHFSMANLNLGMGRMEDADRHFKIAMSIAASYKSEEILPESGSMTAGRLIEIIRLITSRSNQ